MADKNEKKPATARPPAALARRQPKPTVKQPTAPVPAPSTPRDCAEAPAPNPRSS
jgi:hypothetical protein